MNDKVAVIIIDTGFSQQSLQSARKIIAVLDATTGSVELGSPYLTWASDADVLRRFGHDPRNHGSLVLDSLGKVDPDLPVILVRASENGTKLIRTVFDKGQIIRPGWTEAYLTAVHICRTRGLCSVTNLSFGGYNHAMDGTGWESHCLASETGGGKPGHIVVAGAGSGGDDDVHASWRTEPGACTEVRAEQTATTGYNFWSGALGDETGSMDWLLEVRLDSKLLLSTVARSVFANLWNRRKQVSFVIEGAGTVLIRTSRFWNAGTDGKLPVRGTSWSLAFDNKVKATHRDQRPTEDPMRFDCWISRQDGRAGFVDHKDAMTVAEPALFRHVVAVGLKGGRYAPNQNEPGAKPDVLLPGVGPVSFRLPEVVARVAGMLAQDQSLDVVAVLRRLRESKVFW